MFLHNGTSNGHASSMEKTTSKTLFRLLTGTSVVLLLTVLYLGYRIVVISKENRALQTGQYASLEQRLLRTESRIEALTAALADSERVSVLRGSAPPPNPPTRKTSNSIRTAVEKNRVELEKIKDVLASTGLERLAAGDDIDPEVFGSMYSEYTERKRVLNSRQSLMDKNDYQHRQDEDRFDAHLNELYDRARPRRGADADSGDSEAALAEMMDQYPDAYATAMVIAERAFAAMWSRNPTGVEDHYAKLQEIDRDVMGSVVTDRGIEAMPAIELYLARQYLKTGREDEAGALMESLESNYADSLVFSGGNSRGRRWVTVSEALDWIERNRQEQ